MNKKVSFKAVIFLSERVGLLLGKRKEKEKEKDFSKIKTFRIKKEGGLLIVKVHRLKKKKKKRLKGWLFGKKTKGHMGLVMVGFFISGKWIYFCEKVLIICFYPSFFGKKARFLPNYSLRGYNVLSGFLQTELWVT